MWWIPVVWLASFPVGLTDTPQWHRVHPVPFSDPADKLSDLVINLLLFAPFGYSFARRPNGLAWLPPAAALVSISAEIPQLFSTIRYPSGTDVVYAMAGALGGGLLARMRGTRVAG